MKYTVMSCLSAFLLTGMVACNTVPEPRPIILQVPQTLDQSEALIAAAVGIQQGRRIPTGEWERIATSRSTGAVVRNLVVARTDTYERSRAAWIVTSLEEDRIDCRFNFKDKHILFAQVRIRGDECEVALTGSQNMKQEEGLIHSQSIIWMNELVDVVRASLGDYAVYKLTRSEEIR